MLGRQGIASLRRWSTTVPMSTHGPAQHRRPRRRLRLCRGRPHPRGRRPGGRGRRAGGHPPLPHPLPHRRPRPVGRRHRLQRRPDRPQVHPRPDQEPREPVQGAGAQLHDQRRDPDAAAGRGARHLPRGQLADRPRRRRLRPSHHARAAARARRRRAARDLPDLGRGLPPRGAADRGTDPLGLRRPRPRRRGAWTATPRSPSSTGPPARTASPTSRSTPRRTSLAQARQGADRRLPPRGPPGRPGLAGPRQRAGRRRRAAGRLPDRGRPRDPEVPAHRRRLHLLAEAARDRQERVRPGRAPRRDHALPAHPRSATASSSPPPW